MPTCNWSPIGVTHGLNSILNTALLLTKSKFPEILNFYFSFLSLEFLNFLNLISFSIGSTYLFLEVELSIDFLEYVILLIALILQFLLVIRLDHFLLVQAKIKIKYLYTNYMYRSKNTFQYKNILLLTICKFFNCPISGGRYSKSLSAK